MNQDIVYISIPACLILLFFFILHYYEFRQKKLFFEDSFRIVHDFIMESDRNNLHQAIKAGQLLENLKEREYNKTTERQIKQELILWRSKFGPLFREDRSGREAYIVSKMV